MNKEETLLKQLEVYLDLIFTDFDKGRILEYLKDYRASLPAKIAYREVFRTIRERLIPCTDKILLEEGRAICDEYGVDFELFLKSKNGKSTTEIATIRKLFCQRITDNYQCSNNRLITFFRVDHATISFYMNGRVPRKKTA